MAEPPLLLALTVDPEGGPPGLKISQNPELILETWAPKLINAITFCPFMMTGTSLDSPTRLATGSGFKNGMTGVVSHGPLCWAALMLAGLCLGLGWECTRLGQLLLVGVSCIPSVPPGLV